MIVQLLSDLHFEHHLDGGESFLRSLDPTGVDVLVVAGDLDSGERGLVNSLFSLCALYSHVVFVCGNHEYYGWHPHQVHHRLATLDRDVGNLHWLHHGEVVIDGVRFAGTPLWFPRPENPLVMLDRKLVNDFHLIKNVEPWVYEEYGRAVAFLGEAGSRADVIVTHHVPTAMAMAHRFKSDTTNHYFITDITSRLLEWRPKAVLFGHTHDRMWFKLGETLLACNPFGYPHEQGDGARGHYAERCLIDVGDDGASFATDEWPGWPYPGPMVSTPAGGA